MILSESTGVGRASNKAVKAHLLEGQGWMEVEDHGAVLRKEHQE